MLRQWHKELLILLISMMLQNKPVLAGDEWEPSQTNSLSVNGVDPLISTLSRGDTPLHLAIKNGQIDKIDIICQEFPTAMNSVDQYGETPLFKAVRSKLVAVVECVLKHGAAVHEEADGRDANGLNPADRTSTQIAHIIDAKNRKGETPMIVAANLKYWDIVQFLLRKGADPMISTTSWGDTLLHIATKNGQIDAIDFICENFPTAINSVDIHGETPIFNAVRSKLVAVMECVFKYRAAVHEEADGLDSHGPNPAHRTATHIANIIDAKNRKGETPMSVAANLEYWDIVQFLFKKGADPKISTTVWGDTLLHIATRNGQIDAIDFICEKFPTAINAVNNYGETLLLSAVESHSVAVMESVLEYLAAVHEDADDSHSNGKNAADQNSSNIRRIIDAQNAFGMAAIIAAATARQWDMVQLLLKNGADPMISTLPSGVTLLDFAIYNCQIDAIDIICHKFPTAINSVNKDGDTPIFNAVRSKSVEIVDCFFKYPAAAHEEADGLDSNVPHTADGTSTHIANIIDAKNIRGHTPIIVAAHHQYWDIVQFLLKKGADPMIPTSWGDTLLHIATRDCQIDAIDFICEKYPTAINAVSCREETLVMSAVKSHSVAVMERVLKYLAAVHENANDSDSNGRNAVEQKSSNIRRIIDYRNTFGIPPIIVAADDKQWDMVLMLLKMGADPMICKVKSKYTLLQFAMKHGQVDVKNAIVDKHDPVDLMAIDYNDQRKNTPLFLAKKSKQLPATEALLDHIHLHS